MIPQPTMDDRDFTAVRTGTGRALVAAGMPGKMLRRLLRDPEELHRRHLDRPVKLDHGSVIVEADLPFRDGPVHVALKQYRPRNRWKAFCGLWRRSRARRAWELARTLLDRQIDTARPLLMCDSRLRGRSYLATEWIAAAENLHLFGWRLAEDPIDARLRSAGRCAASLGRLIGRMHVRGVAHRDLKAANLLVVDREHETATYLIDVDGVSVGRHVTPRRRAADLARLAAALEAHPWVSRSVCCRFLRAYVAQFPPGTFAWKPLWRDVAAGRGRIVRRKRRQGRRVL